MMTVSQLRDQMMDKVIPEKVMPQNITAFLVDEDAEIPELDAFTFLNRLRSLGIGSADFLYLLKGCNAPAEAVERIESNPAMNLNSLILTLDGSGLTSQDYTRMLYTARQLWERTLTMRISNADEPEPDVKEYHPRAKTAEEYPAPASVSVYETRRVSEEVYEEDTTEPAAAASPLMASGAAATEDTEPETAEELPEENAAERLSVDSIIAELLGEKPLSQKAEETEPSLPAAEPESPSEQSGTFGENETELNITAKVFTETSQFDKMRDYYDEDDAEEDLPPAKTVSPERQYHRGAIITSAVGAAVLLGANAAVGFFGFEPIQAQPVLRPAEDSAEIFSAIYNSYNKGIIGGENAVRYSAKSAEIFGAELLVERQGGFGTFCVDGTVYVCESGAITLAESDTELLPPEGEFVSVFEQDNALFAVFSGNNSGIMRIEDGDCVYVSEQDGELTDLVISDGKISLGTAFVPEFNESFSVQQTEQYMPRVGGAVIPAENVILSGEDGCGYAVSAAYDTKSGAAQSRCAVLGDPIFACADGALFVMAAQDGSLLITENEGEYFSEKAGAVTAFAKQGEICAAAEQTESGLLVYIRGADGTAFSALNNFPEEIKRLSFSGSTLLVSGENGVFLTVDCADPTAPKITSPRRVSGIVKDDLLLTGEPSEAGLTLTLYRISDGAAEKVTSYTKALTEKERESLVLGGAGTSVIAGDNRAGMAYSYFDGVSVVSEFALFGKEQRVVTLYDDRTGITAAAENDGKVIIFHNGVSEIVE